MKVSNISIRKSKYPGKISIFKFRDYAFHVHYTQLIPSMRLRLSPFVVVVSCVHALSRSVDNFI